MPMPKRLEAYTDVAEHLDAALAADGGSIRFATRGAAINWRRRAYYYRRLLTDQSQMYALADDPATRAKAGVTPYDDFVLSLPPAGEPDDTTVVITIGQRDTGEFEPLKVSNG